MRFSKRRVVDEVARGEVVGAVDDHVVAVDDVEHVVGAEADVVRDHVDVGVQLGEGLLRRVDLALADAVHVVQDLALQVRRVDDVHVDDAERADARSREVERGGRAEAARTEQQHAALEQLLLAGLADLGKEDVAAVAVALLGGERLGGDPGPPLVLPAPEPAGHRHDVGEAELLEGLGGEGGAVAAGAIEDDGLVTVEELGLGLALEVAAGDEHRPRDRALVVLVLLAHVDERGLPEARFGVLGLDLGDALLGVPEQLAVTRHPASPSSCLEMLPRWSGIPKRAPNPAPNPGACVVSVRHVHWFRHMLGGGTWCGSDPGHQVGEHPAQAVAEHELGQRVERRLLRR